MFADVKGFKKLEIFQEMSKDFNRIQLVLIHFSELQRSTKLLGYFKRVRGISTSLSDFMGFYGIS